MSNIELSIIQDKIYEIRGRRVMLDFDLAEMYQVETGVLKRSVRRNIERFPTDFMFELTSDEFENLRCQFGISSWGGTRYAPFAFTQEGVAMLSGILRSQVAIQVNIAIMRAFVLLRELSSGYAELKRQLEDYQLNTTMQIAEILDIINEMAVKQNALYKSPTIVAGFKTSIE